MLELKDIRKSYYIGDNAQEVLKGINIKFRRNEFTAILGPSGCGKTTLLNIIGGLDKYDSGDLVIEGISTKDYLDRDWDSYRNYRVGFIFQSYNLIMHQSVLSNVEIALTLSGVSKEERRKRAKEALIKVGLEEHINKRPNQLSGGQMQRVAIARALVNNPEIILADEPTGALDSKTSVQIMDLLKEIAKDKLVIMVTHNPEIANNYANRIIDLKDGVITSDSNPYNNDKNEFKERKIKRTSMSLLTSLSLSFNNLLTKKGRTFLTAFAGSIGIIGIALILSLSNGVKEYTAKEERESLIDYPLTFERTSYDLFGSLALAFNEDEDVLKECPKDKICSTDDIVKESVYSSEKGMLRQNNLKEFKKYIESSKEFQEAASEITYDYAMDLQVYTKDHNKVDPGELILEQSSIFNKLSISEKKYEVLAGKMPENYNEIVLVIPKDGIVKDSTLYSLNIKNRDEIATNLEKIKNDANYRVKSSNYSYSDILDKEYKLILNTDYYKEEDGAFIDYSNDTEYMKEKIDNGLDIKIVGVLKDKDAYNAYVGYKGELVEYVIKEINKTEIFKKQMENKDVNVLTGAKFDGLANNFEMIASALGIYELDDPSIINVYPKDYESKQKIVELVKKYNDEKEKNKEDDLVINYTDLMKTLLDGVTKIVNVISYILIGFVAISLVVSSIMIAIITYISVLERTKEIGILRAIGASKKDITRVFMAETIIEGATAGILGILITLFLSAPINAITHTLEPDIEKIASLPIVSAIILILLSIGLNVIAGRIPSKMAAKKDPVEALRTE